VLAALTLMPRLRGRPNPAVLRELREAENAEDDIYDRLSKSMISRVEDEADKNGKRAKFYDLREGDFSDGTTFDER
jgi:hypothetical protein